METGRTNYWLDKTRYKCELAMVTYGILTSIPTYQGWTGPQHWEAFVVFRHWHRIQDSLSESGSSLLPAHDEVCIKVGGGALTHLVCMPSIHKDLGLSTTTTLNQV